MIYVPTPDEVVEAMCKLGKVGKDDVVYDIGCGDGRMVIQAVKKFGAKRGVGIDLSAERIKDCNANAKKAEVSDRVTFLQKDALTIKDFSEATVVLIYLSDYLNAALRPTLQKTLKPGAHIVSHRFLMGDWKPETTKVIRATDNDGEKDNFQDAPVDDQEEVTPADLRASRPCSSWGGTRFRHEGCTISVAGSPAGNAPRRRPPGGCHRDRTSILAGNAPTRRRFAALTPCNPPFTRPFAMNCTASSMRCR